MDGRTFASCVIVFFAQWMVVMESDLLQTRLEAMCGRQWSHPNNLYETSHLRPQNHFLPLGSPRHLPLPTVLPLVLYPPLDRL